METPHFSVERMSYKGYWEIRVCHNGKSSTLIYEDETLKEEAHIVPMTLYYGGDAKAPTDIILEITVQETSDHCSN
jgi:hypothetical protein